MHLEALGIFCDVVRHRSFSRAAAANAVSQSAASQAVRQIENRLGAQLIDRSQRPWQLTPEGKLFFQGCRDIIERYHELEDAVKRRQEPAGYTVRVASIYSIPLHDLSEYVDRFNGLAPGAEVEIEYMHPDRVYGHILAEQSDIGLISFANPGRARGLTVIPWRNQQMEIACRPNHRIARLNRGRRGVPPRELAGEPFVTFDRGLAVRREIDRFLRRHEVDVTVAAEFDNIENIKQAVEDGAGIAILPAHTVRQEVRRRALVSVPLRLPDDSAPLIRPLSIVHRRKRRLNPAVTEFINLLCNGDGPAAAVQRTQAEPRTPVRGGDADQSARDTVASVS